jgi:hypothetical protein
MHRGIHVKYPLFSSYLNKILMFSKISTNPQIPNFIKICLATDELFNVNEWRDIRTDMTKANLAFRKFANTPKNLKIFAMQEILNQSQIQS